MMVIGGVVGAGSRVGRSPAAAASRLRGAGAASAYSVRAPRGRCFGLGAWHAFQQAEEGALGVGFSGPVFSQVSRRAFRATSVARKRDYYEVLGVPKGSSQADIKKSYFQRAKKYHPDANRDDPNAADKFKEVTEAYEVLKDENKRAAYDAYGHAGVDGSAGGGGGGFGGFGGGGGDPFSEFFRQTQGTYFSGTASLPRSSFSD